MYHCPNEAEAVAANENGRNRDRCCLSMVAAIFGALFLFALGLIFGAVFSATFLAALAAVIVFAAVMLILTIITLAYLACRTRRNR